MAKLYILIKRKGSKRFIGAIPTKKGASVSKLRKIIPKQIKSGYSARIVTEAQFKRLLQKMRPRKAKRSRKVRRIRRKGRTKRRKR